MNSEDDQSTRKRARSSGCPPKPPVVNTVPVQNSIYASPHKHKKIESPSPSMSSGSSSTTESRAGFSLSVPNNNNSGGGGSSNNNGSSSPRSSPCTNATPGPSATHTPLKMLYLTAERERAEECWINRTDVRLKEIEIKGFSMYAVEDWLFEKDMPWVVQALTGSPSNTVRVYRIGINDVFPQYKHMLNSAITADHPEITSHVVNNQLSNFQFLFLLV